MICHTAQLGLANPSNVIASKRHFASLSVNSATKQPPMDLAIHREQSTNMKIIMSDYLKKTSQTLASFLK